MMTLPSSYFNVQKSYNKPKPSMNEQQDTTALRIVISIA